MSAEGLPAAQREDARGRRRTRPRSTSSPTTTRSSRRVRPASIAEADIEPLDRPAATRRPEPDDEAGARGARPTVVIKLNGGLGTSMGMDTREVAAAGARRPDLPRHHRAPGARMRGSSTACGLPLMLMNSFRTRDDTLDGAGGVPRPAGRRTCRSTSCRTASRSCVADDLTPVDVAGRPEPRVVSAGPRRPLHRARTRPGLLDAAARRGLPLRLRVQRRQPLRHRRCRGWRAGSPQSGAPFASEVCRRTAADRKGGHLAIRRRDRQLVLRESAQTAPEDEEAFADITRHRYFNTNNLWIDLRRAWPSTLDGHARRARPAADPQREDRRPEPTRRRPR